MKKPARWVKKKCSDYDERLAHYRRYADPRYYKGVEYADVVESLARRRCAEVFATPAYPAERLFVNVQPLSGAPANNAVYTALLNPGDTIMGMNLLHGGHLTHGSSVNRSGKLYKVVHYNVDPQTEHINYDTVEALAVEHKPKIIIAGYSSYSWVPDWQRFRAIADAVGAILLADISHIAGLVAAGAVPSPVGHAHVITFTTHKTLTGPRGACIITTDAALTRKIDRAVFPGEQGGPHVHAFAALATTFKLAQTEQFKQLQRQIIKNCQALNDRLTERGLRVVYGGSDTHLTNLDCKTMVGPDGTPLSGDMAARILDIAGLVTNRNTIPGDKTAMLSHRHPPGHALDDPARPEGIRHARSGRHHRGCAAVDPALHRRDAPGFRAARQGRFHPPRNGQAARARAGRKSRASITRPPVTATRTSSISMTRPKARRAYLSPSAGLRCARMRITPSAATWKR